MNNFLEEIINQAPVFIAAKDKNLKYIYCNENLARGLGLESPRQIVGKTDYNLFESKTAKLYQDGDIKTLNGGMYINQIEYQPHVYKTIDILVSKHLLQNSFGKVKGVVVSFIEINKNSELSKMNSFSFDRKKRRYYFLIQGENEYFTLMEYNIFIYLTKGYPIKRIAQLINLSPRTIDSHVENIKRKLQCHSKYHIIEAAVHYGLSHL